MKAILTLAATALLAACAGFPTASTSSTADLARIESGKTTRDDVRKLLGAPYQMSSLPRQSREVWEYHLREGGGGQTMFVYVQFSPDGLAREIMSLPESQVMSTFGGQSH